MLCRAGKIDRRAMGERPPDELAPNYAVPECIIRVSLTLLQFFLSEFPQLVDLWRCTSDSPLNNICTPSQRSPRRNCICCRQGPDFDDTDPRVFWSSIMLPVLQIAKPCFQGRGVVFANRLTVSDNVGFAGDGGPFARRIEEGNVDLGFRLQIIGFARFRIGMEKEVNAASFLS